MKVLVVHNRYMSSSPSGENQVVEWEIAALRDRGVEVVEYLRDSDEIADMALTEKAALPVRPVWARDAVADVAEVLRAEQPDLMHVHNVYPLVSPAVVRTAKRARVPVVHTVHNHRHACVKGTFYRDGAVCRDCVGKRLAWPSAVHGCYQQSRLRSLPMVASLAVHRRTWLMVDRFLALTPQLAGHLVDDVGVPAELITVRPNTVEDPGPSGEPAGTGFLFVGRLSEEKGIDLLLQAWALRRDGAPGTLTVVGDGPLRPQVETFARTRDDVRVLGAVSRQQVTEELGLCASVVIPSTCPEAFPRIAAEAFAAGRPVVATRLGGLPGIVTEPTGEVVDVSPAALLAGMEAIRLRAPAAGEAARQRYLDAFHPDVVMGQLLEVYVQVTSGEPSPVQEHS